MICVQSMLRIRSINRQHSPIQRSMVSWAFTYVRNAHTCSYVALATIHSQYTANTVQCTRGLFTKIKHCTFHGVIRCMCVSFHFVPFRSRSTFFFCMLSQVGVLIVHNLKQTSVRARAFTFAQLYALYIECCFTTNTCTTSNRTYMIANVQVNQCRSHVCCWSQRAQMIIVVPKLREKKKRLV